MLVYLLECLSSIFEHNRVESLLPKSYEDHVNSLMTYFEIPDFQCRERLFTKVSLKLLALNASFTKYFLHS